MDRHLRTAMVVTQYEWKLQVRQRATWMMACLFFLIGWFSVDHAQLPMLSAIAIAESTAQGLGVFGSLFVVIFGATGLLREFGSTYDLLWGRSFSMWGYTIGKCIGTCVVIGTLLLPVGLWVGYWEVISHGVQGLAVQAVVWIVLLIPVLTLAVAVTWWIGVVFRHSVWTALVLVLVIGAILALQMDITHIVGFPIGAYVSPLIDFGPDTRLVKLHQNAFLVVSFLGLLAGYVLFRAKPLRLEPRIDLVSQWTSALLLFGLLTLLGLIVRQFRIERNLLLQDPRRTGSIDQGMESPCATLRSYRLALSIDLDNVHMEGAAEVLLKPTARVVQFPIELNQGLHISKIATNPSNLKTELVDNQLVLKIPQDFVQREVALVLEYAGNIRISRRLYDRQFRSPVESLAPFWPGGYLDRKTVFLVRDGNWHPFPWCAPNRLFVEVEGSSGNLIHTAGKIESSPDRFKLTWFQNPPLPLIALSRNYRMMNIDNAKVLVAPMHLSTRQWKEILTPYPVLMKSIQEYLLEETPPPQGHYKIVQVPLLKYGRYDPGLGVLFLKEFSPLDFLVPRHYVSSAGPLHSQELLYRRWVAERMMRTWWCRESICPKLQVTSSRGYEIGHLLLAQPQSLGEAEHAGLETLDALLSYAALRLGASLVGDEFITAEMSARNDALQDEMMWTEFLLPLIYSPETNRLMLRLHKLWEMVGPGPFWHMVRETHRIYGDQPVSAKEFSDFVKKTTGQALPLLND